MQQKLRLAFAAVLLSSTSLSNAFAQENETTKVTATDEVTVYATREAQSTFDVPASVTIIDADAPGNATAGNTADLLQFAPNVDVANGPRRSSQVVTIRGFDDEAILTLIDGRRQNFESGHDGRFFLDPSLLKSVEVVRGATSAIYGGGAVGGVVAFDTKDAADLLEPGETFGVTTSMSVRTATDELAPSVIGYGRHGDLDLVGSVSYKKAGDVSQGNDQRLTALDRIYSGMGKVGYTFGDFHTVRGQVNLLNHDGEEPSNSAGAVTSTSNRVVDKDIEDFQVSAKYEYDNPDNNWLKPKIHFYRNETAVQETDLSGSNAGRVRERKMETVSLTVDNQSRLAFSDGHTHTLSYGGEFYQDDQTSSSSTGTYAGVPQADAENYGFYLQDSIVLDTDAGRFNLIPAARFDSYESSDSNGNSQDESAVSPKLSLSYKPTKNYMVFASWAKAFRAPNLTEIYASGQHFPGFGPFPANNFVPNPDLKPETIKAVEFGGGVNFDNVITQSDEVQVKGTYFIAKGKDFIDQEISTAGGTTENVNIPKARLEGWEIDASYKWEALNTSLALSKTDAINDVTKAYLEASQPLTLATSVSYDVQNGDGVVGWRAKFVDANRKATSVSNQTDGYSVHDVFYRFAPADGQLKNFTLDLGIENLFDKAYTPNYATLYAEGRSYVGRIAYKW